MLELREDARGLGRKPRQHGALILVEVIARGMRSIENHRVAAKAIADRNGENGPGEPFGKVVSASAVAIDAEWAAGPQRGEHCILGVELSCRGVVPPAMVFRGTQKLPV